MHMSQRALKINPSPTLALDAKAKALRQEGVDVVNFGVGEPDFDTPEHIKEAAIRALREGRTKYTPVAGIPELRRAIVEKLHRDNALDYAEGQIVVSAGAKHSLYNAFQVLVDPGDEVVIPAPYWVTYPEQVRLAGGIPVFVPTRAEDGFRLDPAAVAERIGPRTRVILLNSPSNPTGAVYPRSDLAAIGELALRHDLYLISDEIYEHLVYDGAEHVSVAALDPQLRERTVVVNGMSKAYAMTGWRVGYAAAAAPVAKAMTDLQSQSTSNVTSIAQWAAVAALAGTQEPLRRMQEAFARRRELILAELAELPRVRVSRPGGAFYAFPDLGGHLGRRFEGREVADVDTLAEVLLTAVGVAAVPGSGFGAPDHLRFSYALGEEAIREGMRRVREVLARMQ